MKPLANSQNRFFTGSLHLLGVLVVAIAIGGFYALVYQPLQRKQERHVSRSEQLHMLLVQPDSKGSEYSSLRSRLQEMKESVADVHHQLSDDRTELEVIDSIAKLAASVDLSVNDYQVGRPIVLPTHTATEVEFLCNGSYASICQFMEQAEQLTKTTKLSKFELDSRANSHGYPIQLTFVLYSGGKSNDTKEK